MSTIQRRVFGTSVGLFAAISLASSVRGQDADPNSIEQAFLMARKTGRPVLVLGTRPGCGLCTALKERFSKEASLHPMLAQYIPLNINVDSPAWQGWSAKYQQPGNSLPFVYAVRADGILMGSQSSPQGPALPQFLQAGIAKSGRLLDDKASAILTKSTQKAEKLLTDGKFAEAADEMGKYLSVNSYAESVVAAQKVTQKIVDEGKTKLADAGTKLDTASDALDGAIALAALERSFKRYPELSKEIREIETKHKEHKALFTQAAVFDKAVALEEKEQVPQAIAAYKVVATRFADTPVATLAEDAVKRLESDAGKPAAKSTEVASEDTTDQPAVKSDPKVAADPKSAVEPKTAVGPKVAEEKPSEKPAGKPLDPSIEKPAPVVPAPVLKVAVDPRRAPAYLLLAKGLAAEKSPRAKEYFQKAIAAAPGSEIAQEAAELLEQLDAK